MKNYSTIKKSTGARYSLDETLKHEAKSNYMEMSGKSKSIETKAHEWLPRAEELWGEMGSDC